MADQARTVFGSTLAAIAVAACLLAPTDVAGEPQPRAGSKARSAKAKADASQASDQPQVTFTGYQTLPGGRGLVFVELTDTVAVEVTRAGNVIEYKLIGATVPLRNNKN